MSVQQPETATSAYNLEAQSQHWMAKQTKKTIRAAIKKKHIGQGASSAQNTTIINSQSLEDAQAG